MNYVASGEVIVQSAEASVVLPVWAAQFSRIVALVASPLAQLYRDHSALVSLHNIWLNMRTCHVLNVLKIIILIKTVSLNP